CVFFEGNVLYDGNGIYGGFSFLIISRSLIVECKKFVFKDGVFVLSKEKDYDLKPIVESKRKYALDANHMERLSGVGPIITHNNKRDLSKRDICVMPKLRHYVSGRTNYVSSKYLFDADFEYIELSGEERAGKTFLLEVCALEFYEKGFLPIILDCKNDVSNRDIRKVLRRAIVGQYKDGEAVVEEILSLQKEFKVCFVDNIHLLRDDVKASIFVDMLRGYCFKIIATTARGCENMAYEVVRTMKYVNYDIMHFGNYERDLLVQKWIDLEQLPQDVSYEKRVAVHNRLNDVVGRNMVPSYPVYLLAIIQSLETPQSPNNEVSSYGYCYQTLIFMMLTKGGVVIGDLDTYYNVLAHFSFGIYEERISSASPVYCQRFFSGYSERYCLLISPDKIIKSLVDSGILLDDGFSNVSFRYKYIFDYFVAKYISDNLSENKGLVSQLCGRIYDDECAMILLFLTHHSKNTEVLDEIIYSTMAIYQEMEPIRFDSVEMSFMDSVVENITHKLNQDIDYQKYRSDSLIRQDDNEMICRCETDKDDEAASDSDIEESWVSNEKRQVMKG
ncbi:MAG: hypothetical protein HGB12_17420, partial [Bacteroidetes bacterium]|nr:hypothetical protein [Bacteroidota bacterium]